jgi:hypothetical protein
MGSFGAVRGIQVAMAHGEFNFKTCKGIAAQKVAQSGSWR